MADPPPTACDALIVGRGHRRARHRARGARCGGRVAGRRARARARHRGRADVGQQRRDPRRRLLRPGLAEGAALRRRRAAALRPLRRARRPGRALRQAHRRALGRASSAAARRARAPRGRQRRARAAARRRRESRTSSRTPAASPRCTCPTPASSTSRASRTRCCGDVPARGGLVVTGCAVDAAVTGGGSATRPGSRPRAGRSSPARAWTPTGSRGAAAADADPRIVPFRGAYLRAAPARARARADLPGARPGAAVPRRAPHAADPGRRRRRADRAAGARRPARHARLAGHVADGVALAAPRRARDRVGAVARGLRARGAHARPRGGRRRPRPGFAGVRAQAVGRDGALLDDFVLDGRGRRPARAQRAVARGHRVARDRRRARRPRGPLERRGRPRGRTLGDDADPGHRRQRRHRRGPRARARAGGPRGARVRARPAPRHVRRDQRDRDRRRADRRRPRRRGRRRRRRLPPHPLDGAGRAPAARRSPSASAASAAHVVAACERAGVRRVVYLGGLVPRGRARRPSTSPAGSPSRTRCSARPPRPSRCARRSSSARRRARSASSSGSSSARPSSRSRRGATTAPSRSTAATSSPTSSRPGPRRPSTAPLSLDIAGPGRPHLRRARPADPRRAAARSPADRAAVLAHARRERRGGRDRGRGPRAHRPADGGPRAATCSRATTAPHELFGVRLHRFDAAVERALRDWEASEELAAR